MVKKKGEFRRPRMGDLSQKNIEKCSSTEDASCIPNTRLDLKQK